MVIEQIKENWDCLWEDKIIHYFPKSNQEQMLTKSGFPIKVKYAPERANRFVSKKKGNLPLGEKIWERKDCLYDFENLALLANNRPVSQYHSILCSKKHHEQNELSEEEIREVTGLVEKYDFRSFLNLKGTAATLNHFHTQVLMEEFHVEKLNKKKIHEHLFIMKDYPGANLVITGDINERCRYLFELIHKLSNSHLPCTIQKDGKLSSHPLFTLLFWKNCIAFIPRKQEWSYLTGAMVGGLELSGYFLITAPLTSENPFEGLTYEKLIEVIRDVCFKQNEIQFLYK